MPPHGGEEQAASDVTPAVGELTEHQADA